MAENPGRRWVNFAVNMFVLLLVVLLVKGKSQASPFLLCVLQAVIFFLGLLVLHMAILRERN